MIHDFWQQAPATVAALTSEGQYRLTAKLKVTAMADDAPAKILVKRPAKIKSDGRGRSVWVDPIESAELELV